MSMFSCNCTCRCRCALIAIVVSAILGVIGAFLQIAGVITVAPVFLWVALGVAVVYLVVLLIAAALAESSSAGRCICEGVNTLLVGILGAILFALVLLAVGIVATSVLSAILVGLLIFFLALTFTSTACLIRSLLDCECRG